jgi:hypothetical protein
VEPIAVEAQRLRAQCADPATADGDPDLTALRRRYLRLLESEPVPTDDLRRDIRRDLARSTTDDTKVVVVALLIAAAVVIAFSQYISHEAPGLFNVVGYALDAGLLLTIPALTAGEASRWRSAVRASSRRDLNDLLPRL